MVDKPDYAKREYMVETVKFPSAKELSTFINKWAEQGYTLNTCDQYEDGSWLVIMERPRRD
jgi:hypothetical protein